MNELEQASTVVDNEMDQLADERNENVDFKWLTDKTRETMAISIDKAAKGIEIKKHNAYIGRIIAILKKDYVEEPQNRKYNVKDVGELFAIRKTKRGVSFYGYQPELYSAVRGAKSNELAEL